MRGSACPATVFPSSDRRAISRRRGTIDEIASRAASSHGIRIHLHDSDPMFIRCGGRNNETRGIEHFRFTSGRAQYFTCANIHNAYGDTCTQWMEMFAQHERTTVTLVRGPRARTAARVVIRDVQLLMA